MFTRLRKHLGTAGLLVAVVALVAALGGGAVAAQSGGDATASAKKKKGKQGGLNAKQKRQVIAIAKRFQGSGPAGPAGPAGPQGPKGDSGNNGGTGATGKSVTVSGTADGCDEGGVTVQVEGDAGSAREVCNGEEGDDGLSVTNTPEGEGENCSAGGAKLQVGAGTPTYACNGEDGETGFTATLPPGATETGTWVFHQPGSDTTQASLPISFPIPLADDLGDGRAHYINKDGLEVIVDFDTEEIVTVPSTDCLGDVETPTAEPGNLCIYEASNTSAIAFSQAITRGWQTGSAGFTGSAGTTGAILPLQLPTAQGSASGTWAVRACGTGFPCP